MKKQIQKFFRSMLGIEEHPASAITEHVATTRRALNIRQEVIARAGMNPKESAEAPRIEPYKPPRGVIPADKRAAALAMDSTDYDHVNEYFAGQHFRGYPYLALLSQRPEYAKMSRVIATEMTRKWIMLKSASDGDKSEAIKIIDAELKRLKVRKHFRKAALHDGLFGRSQIFIDVKGGQSGASTRDDPDEMKTPLILDAAKVPKDGLIGLRVVEPVWTYPSMYNSNKPLAPDFYKPSAWYVMGMEVHTSRLLTFVSRDVPDILKAAYNFGGISITQLAEPYVEHWIRTRNSVSDMVHSYSLTGVATNMEGTLSGDDSGDLFDRAELFNKMRDNRNLMLIDKESEEFFQFNTPLSGLSELQAQSQEQMSSVSSIPLVKFLGITPSGLNASSDGEIRVFYDDIHANQEAIFRDPLTVVIHLIQLAKFGEIDPDITFDFLPLWQPNESEQSIIRKTDAETDAVLIGAGVVMPDESRARIAADPNSGYNSIEVNAELPAVPEDDDRNDD